MPKLYRNRCEISESVAEAKQASFIQGRTGTENGRQLPCWLALRVCGEVGIKLITFQLLTYLSMT